jgi:ABC-type multidrug transport system permease subunit
MFKARTMEFVRDRGSFAWALFFPVFLVFGFAFAFSGSGAPLFKAGVIGHADTSLPFMQTTQIQFISYDSSPAGALKAQSLLGRQQIDMLVDFNAKTVMFNAKSDKSLLLRRLFTAENNSFAASEVSGNGVRYVDWFVPGVIGMNMMFSCLFGVGFVIVRYRKNGVLKRLKATPISAFNFLASQAASRLSIVLFTSIFVFAGTNIFLHFMMLGSYLNLLLLMIVASLCMISLGLVFASRIKNEELAGGLLNLITYPMLAFSGVFYSLEGSPPVLRTIGNIFPLTHFTNAARKIMLDGAGLAQIAPELLILGLMTAFFLLVASFLFKWE